MKTNLFFISLISLLVFGCKPAIITKTNTCDTSQIPTYNQNHPKKNQLKALLDEVVSEGIPGVSLLIRDADGLWIGASGKADIANNTSMEPCNATRIASITKPMVVVTAWRLHEQGKLNCNNLISAYLDEDIIKNIDNADKVTIRQCMNHTSGIFDHVGDLNYQTAILNDPTKQWTAKQLVKFAYGHKAYFAPGAEVKYSNINTILVAMCIDKVTGKDHGASLHDQIFVPLGMNNSIYYWYDKLLPGTANGYFDLYSNNHIVNVSNFNTGLGHTAVYSKVYDLNLFLEALLVQKTLVSPSSLNQMEQWVKVDSTTDYGEGLFRRNLGHSNDKARAGIGHTGGEFGYSGKWFYYPAADVSIISLCNYGTNIKTPLGDKYHAFHQKLEKLLMP